LSSTSTHPAIRGTLDFNSFAFSFSTGRFDFNANDALIVTGTGFYLGYDPSDPGVQTLMSLDNATVSVPKFDIAGSISGMRITTAGIYLGSASIGTTAKKSIGSAASPILEFDGLTLSIRDFAIEYAAASQVRGSIQVSASHAALMPRSSTFNATVTNVSGGFSFSSSGISNIHLMIGSFVMNVGSSFRITSSQVELTPDSDRILSIGSLSATLPSLNDLTGTITEFQVWRSGEVSVGSIALSTTGLADAFSIGEFLPIDLLEIKVEFQRQGQRRIFCRFSLYTGISDWHSAFEQPCADILFQGKNCRRQIQAHRFGTDQDWI
jgi:hypothetical protein